MSGVTTRLARVVGIGVVSGLLLGDAGVAAAQAARDAALLSPTDGPATALAVVTQEAPIYVMPDAGREPIRVARPGSRLRVLGRTSEWINVEFKDPPFNRRAGYVRATLLDIREAAAAPTSSAAASAVAPANAPTASAVAPAQAPAQAPAVSAPQAPTARVRPAGAATAAAQGGTAAPRVRQASTSAPPVGSDMRERVWIAVDVARYRTLQDGFTTADSFTLFRETASSSVFYPPLPDVTDLALGVGVRISDTVGFGAKLDLQNYDSTPAFTLSLPSPYFFNTPGVDVAVATDPVTRRDRAVDLHVVFTPRSPDAVRVRLFAGPTIFHVRNEMVEDLRYSQFASQFFRVNTVSITGFMAQEVGGAALGVNAGADVAWFFVRHVGLGGGVAFNRGRKTVIDPLSGESIDLRLGHVSIGAGLRLRF